VLVFLLGIPSTQARVLPGTHESVLHDGVRQVVTDGRATLFMDLGATQVELRLGPDTREVPAVLLWTPGGGRVVYSLRELAPDVRLRRETHVGVAWMARYVVDRPGRTLLLAVDNLMDRLMFGASQDTGATWVALSLDTGAPMAVDGDLILQTHLASVHGRAALAKDLRRFPDRLDRLAERAAASAVSPPARVRALRALVVAGRKIDAGVARKLMLVSRGPDAVASRSAAAELFARARGKTARGPLLALARRGRLGDGAVAGAGLAVLSARGLLPLKVATRLASGPSLEGRRAGLRALGAAPWADAGGVLASAARDPAVAASAAAALCSSDAAAQETIAALVGERGPAAGPLLECLDPSALGGVDLLARSVEGDVPVLLSTLTDALWRASDVKGTRARMVDVLLGLAAEPDQPERLSLLLGARGFDPENEAVGQAVLKTVRGAPELPWTPDALQALVTTTWPSSLQVLMHIAGAASDPGVAAAAQQLALQADWHDDLEEGRRVALIELWTARPDLAESPFLDELIKRSEPRSVALLGACASRGGENTRQVSAGLLYGTEWRGKAKPAFIDHLMMSSEPVPWTSDLLEFMKPPRRHLGRESLRLLVRAIHEGGAEASEHARILLEQSAWASDLLAERESVDLLVALVREGRGAASQTARRVLVRQRWTGEAKASLDAVSSELGLPRNPRAERRKRVLRLMKDLTEQGGRR
jgi:hypothetical protein